MKRIVFVLAALFLFSAGASGQMMPDAKVYDKFGTTFKKNGRDLSDTERMRELSDVNGLNLNPEWTRYCRLRKAGMGMMIGGGVLTAASGSAFYHTSKSYHIRKEKYLEDSPMLPVYRGYVWGAGAATLASLAVFGTGIGLFVSSNAHLESIVSTANMSLGLQGTADGVGITLRF